MMPRSLWAHSWFEHVCMYTQEVKRAYNEHLTQTGRFPTLSWCSVNIQFSTSLKPNDEGSMDDKNSESHFSYLMAVGIVMENANIHALTYVLHLTNLVLLGCTKLWLMIILLNNIPQP